MNPFWGAALVRGRNVRTADQRRRVRLLSNSAVWLVALAVVTLSTTGAVTASSHKHAPAQVKKAAKAEHHKGRVAREARGHPASKAKRNAAAQRSEDEKKQAVPLPTSRPAAADRAALPPDLAATKQAIELVRQGKPGEATTLAASTGNPVAQKIVEWALLRRRDSEAGLERYAAFIRANPDWPSIALLRRRAEEKLWEGRYDTAAVRRFVGEDPTSAAGQLAVARVEMAGGNRASAESKVRAVWRSAPLSGEMEAAVLAAFPGTLTRTDHVARMDRRIGAKDFGAAMRTAKRIGDDYVAVVKACSAAETKSNKGGALLDKVSADARGDLGYALCRVHWLLRNDSPGSNVRGRIVTPKADFAAAVKLVLAATRGPHIASCSRPRPRPILITAPISTSWPAGSRCAFSPIPRLRLSISHKW